MNRLILCIMVMLIGGLANAQSWFAPHAQLDIPDQPNSETFQKLIGINLQKTLSKIEFNESNPFPYRGTFRSARSFHLMELDYMRGFNPNEIELLPNMCDCETVSAPNPDLNCGYNAQCSDLLSPNARSGFTDWKTWYCAWRSQAFGFNEIYASIEAIDFKPRGAGSCPNTSERRPYPSKWYTADEWGGTANEMARQNSKKYVKAFIKTFCPDASEGRPCMVEVLEIGNEPWGAGMNGIYGDAGDTPGVEGYKQIILGAVDACREEYGDDINTWPMKISTAAFDAFGPDPGVVTTPGGSDSNRYIGKMIPDEAKPYISFVSLHPYGLPLDYSDLSNPTIDGRDMSINQKPESDNGMYLTMKNMIEWKNNNGLTHADVNITEFGWNDDNGGESLCYQVSGEGQSAYTVRAYLLAARYDIHRAFAYAYTKNNEWLYCATHFLDDVNDNPTVSDFREKKVHAAIRKWTSSDIADKRFLSVLGQEDYSDDGNIVYVVGDENGRPTHLVAWKANVLSDQSPDTDFFANNNTPLTSISLPSTSLTVSNGNRFFYLNADDSRDGTINSRSIVTVDADNTSAVNVRLSGTPVVIELNPTNCRYNDTGELVDCDIVPTCFDGIQNGSETGVDCGGDCPGCETAPTCSDNTQNGNETGIDCGGDCPPCDDLVIEDPTDDEGEGTPTNDYDCIVFDMSDATFTPSNGGTRSLVDNQPTAYPPTTDYQTYNGWVYPDKVLVDLGSAQSVGNIQLYSKVGNLGVIEIYRGDSDRPSDKIGTYQMNTEGWIIANDFIASDLQTFTLKRVSGSPKVEEITLCTEEMANRPPAPPTVWLSTIDDMVDRDFKVDVAFNKSVTGLETRDFEVQNGRAIALSGSAANYQLQVVPIDNGMVTVLLPSSSAVSDEGEGNLLSNIVTVDYVAPTCNDGIQNGNETDVDCGGSCPPCEVVDPPSNDDCTYFDLSNVTLSPISMSALNLINNQPGHFPPTTSYNTYNGWVYPFVVHMNLGSTQHIGDIRLYHKGGHYGVVEIYKGNSTALADKIGTFSMSAEGWMEAADFTATTTEMITLKIAGGNPKVEEIAMCTTGGAAPEPQAPTITLSTGSTTVDGDFEVALTADMAIMGLEAADFIIENGTITGITGSDDVYNISVMPTMEGLVTIQLLAGTVTNTAGMTNTASNIVEVVYLIPVSCDDGIQNGNETGVDCGGDCAPCQTTPTDPLDCSLLDLSAATFSPSYGSAVSMIDQQPSAYPPTTTYPTFDGWVYPNVVYMDLGSPQIIGDIQLYSKGFNNGEVVIYAGQSEGSTDRIGTYQMGSEGWVSTTDFIPTMTQFITLKRTSGTPKVEEIAICASAAPEQAIRQEATAGSTIELSNSDLRVFPNPAKDHIDVSITRPVSGDATLQIINAQGQLVAQYQLGFVEGENQLRLDISELPDGMYHLWLPEGKRKKGMVRFVKQH